MPLHLKHAISIPTQTQTVHVLTYSYLLYLIPSRIYTPLRRPILYLKHSNTQRKVYHTMPLHTYTANFTTSSNVQLISNIPFTYLFVLIIYGITTHIGHKHHSHIFIRSHVTCFQGGISKERAISASVVQGSGIGPSSFIVCASDLHPVREENKMAKYADDTYLLVGGSMRHTLVEEI